MGSPAALPRPCRSSSSRPRADQRGRSPSAPAGYFEGRRTLRRGARRRSSRAPRRRPRGAPREMFPRPRAGPRNRSLTLACLRQRSQRERPIGTQRPDRGTQSAVSSSCPRLVLDALMRLGQWSARMHYLPRVPVPAKRCSGRMARDEHPSRARPLRDPSRIASVHWRLDFPAEHGGKVARLVMDVKEDRGMRPGYPLKLNSYDLGVDIELADAIPARSLRASRGCRRSSSIEREGPHLLLGREHLHARQLDARLQGELLQVHERDRASTSRR